METRTEQNMGQSGAAALAATATFTTSSSALAAPPAVGQGTSDLEKQLIPAVIQAELSLLGHSVDESKKLTLFLQKLISGLVVINEVKNYLNTLSIKKVIQLYKNWLDLQFDLKEILEASDKKSIPDRLIASFDDHVAAYINVMIGDRKIAISIRKNEIKLAHWLLSFLDQSCSKEFNETEVSLLLMLYNQKFRDHSEEKSVNIDDVVSRLGWETLITDHIKPNLIGDLEQLCDTYQISNTRRKALKGEVDALCNQYIHKYKNIGSVEYATPKKNTPSHLKITLGGSVTHYEEHIVLGDGNCGFTALGVSRQTLCDRLLAFENDEEARNFLHEEIYSALISREWSHPAAMALLDNYYAAIEGRRKNVLYFKKLAEADLTPQEKLAVASYDHEAFITFINNHRTLFIYRSYLNRNNKDIRLAERRLKEFAQSKEIFRAYIKSYQDTALWLGIKSAWLYARAQNITLYVFRRDDANPGQLQIMYEHVVPAPSNIIYLHFTAGSHFNLLTQVLVEAHPVQCDIESNRRLHTILLCEDLKTTIAHLDPIVNADDTFITAVLSQAFATLENLVKAHSCLRDLEWKNLLNMWEDYKKPAPSKDIKYKILLTLQRLKNKYGSVGMVDGDKLQVLFDEIESQLGTELPYDEFYLSAHSLELEEFKGDIPEHISSKEKWEELYSTFAKIASFSADFNTELGQLLALLKPNNAFDLLDKNNLVRANKNTKMREIYQEIRKLACNLLIRAALDLKRDTDVIKQLFELIKWTAVQENLHDLLNQQIKQPGSPRNQIARDVVSADRMGLNEAQKPKLVIEAKRLFNKISDDLFKKLYEERDKTHEQSNFELKYIGGVIRAVYKIVAKDKPIERHPIIRVTLTGLKEQELEEGYAVLIKSAVNQHFVEIHCHKSVTVGGKEYFVELIEPCDNDLDMRRKYLHESNSRSLIEHQLSDFIKWLDQAESFLFELKESGLALTDIKPGNLYLRNDRICFSDIKSLRIINNPSDWMTTPEFKAPEYVLGSACDAYLGSLYSLGMSFCQLLTNTLDIRNLDQLDQRNAALVSLCQRIKRLCSVNPKVREDVQLIRVCTTPIITPCHLPLLGKRLDRKTLLETLDAYPGLTHLDLSGCEQITDQDVREIEKRCSNITVLILDNLPQLKQLYGSEANARLKFPKLKLISVQGCVNLLELHIQGTAELKIEAKGCQNLLCLNTKYELSQLRQLRSVLKLTGPISLSLTELLFTREVFIGAAGIEVLAKGLCFNTRMLKLNLSHQNIGDEIRYLAELVRSNDVLINVNLSRNAITGDGCKWLAEALKSNHSIASLDLGHNQIGDRGAIALAEVLAENQVALWNLCLSYNLIGQDGLHALRKALNTNTSLIYMGLEEVNPIPALMLIVKGINAQLSHNQVKPKQAKPMQENHARQPSGPYKDLSIENLLHDLESMENQSVSISRASSSGAAAPLDATSSGIYASDLAVAHNQLSVEEGTLLHIYENYLGQEQVITNLEQKLNELVKERKEDLEANRALDNLLKEPLLKLFYLRFQAQFVATLQVDILSISGKVNLNPETVGMVGCVIGGVADMASGLIPLGGSILKGVGQLVRYSLQKQDARNQEARAIARMELYDLLDPTLIGKFLAHKVTKERAHALRTLQKAEVGDFAKRYVHQTFKLINEFAYGAKPFTKELLLGELLNAIEKNRLSLPAKVSRSMAAISSSSRQLPESEEKKPTSQISSASLSPVEQNPLFHIDARLSEMSHQMELMDQERRNRTRGQEQIIESQSRQIAQLIAALTAAMSNQSVSMFAPATTSSAPSVSSLSSAGNVSALFGSTSSALFSPSSASSPSGSTAGLAVSSSSSSSNNHGESPTSYSRLTSSSAGSLR